MAERFGNLAQTTLAAAITTAGQTSISLTNGGAPFPTAAQFRVRIDNEIIIVTAGAGSNTWTVTRGAEGTTATTHLIAAAVTHVLTAASLPSATGIRNPCSPDWGAVGDNTADDLTAIQNCINAGNGIVLLPPLTFKTTGTLTVPAGVWLVGSGEEATIINYTGSGTAIVMGSDTLAGSDDPQAGLRIADLRITGTASGVSAIRVRGATRWRIQNVRIHGFTTGNGILLNGASFIGVIWSCRVSSCAIGLSAQKQAGDGADGRGMACNAIEVGGGTEFQTCGYGIQIGSPTVTETAPVVGQMMEIHGCTIEGSTSGGIWNVGGNVINIHDNYFEANTGFEVRIGSTSGNTSIPVMCSVTGNFFYVLNTKSLDLLRALDARVERNYFVADSAAGKTAMTVAANCTDTHIAWNFVNTLATVLTDAGVNTSHWTMQGGSPRLELGTFQFFSDLGARMGSSDFGQTSIGRVGPGNEAGLLMGSAADARLYRIAAAKIGTDGDIAINAAGKGLQVKSGANAKCGTATANGTTAVVVNTTAVTANSQIFLTIQTPGGTPGAPFVSAVVAGTSFSFKSVAGDTSTVGWMIVEKL